MTPHGPHGLIFNESDQVNDRFRTLQSASEGFHFIWQVFQSRHVRERNAYRGSRTIKERIRQIHPTASVWLTGTIGSSYRQFAPTAKYVSTRFPNVPDIDVGRKAPVVLFGVFDLHVGSFNLQPRSLYVLSQSNLRQSGIRGPPSFNRLQAYDNTCDYSDNDKHPIGLFEGCIPLRRVGTGFGLIACAAILIFWRGKDDGRLALVSGGPFAAGCLIWLCGQHTSCEDCGNCGQRHLFQHIRTPPRF